MECHCFNSNASVKLAKLDPVFSSIVTCDSEPALREALDGCPATWTTYVFPVAVGVVAYLLGCLTIVLTRGKKDR